MPEIGALPFTVNSRKRARAAAVHEEAQRLIEREQRFSADHVSRLAVSAPGSALSPNESSGGPEEQGEHVDEEVVLNQLGSRPALDVGRADLERRLRAVETAFDELSFSLSRHVADIAVERLLACKTTVQRYIRKNNISHMVGAEVKRTSSDLLAKADHQLFAGLVRHILVTFRPHQPQVGPAG